MDNELLSSAHIIRLRSFHHAGVLLTQDAYALADRLQSEPQPACMCHSFLTQTML